MQYDDIQDSNFGGSHYSQQPRLTEIVSAVVQGGASLLHGCSLPEEPVAHSAGGRSSLTSGLSICAMTRYLCLACIQGRPPPRLQKVCRFQARCCFFFPPVWPMSLKGSVLTER